MEDVKRLCDPSTSWNSNPESIIRAVGDVLQSKPNESNSYRRFRIFSGVHPTPPGEDNLDSWLEQVKFMTDEYECSDKEKRRRIIESLKGPALEIIQAVRMSNPMANHMDYLQARHWKVPLEPQNPVRNCISHSELCIKDKVSACLTSC